MAADDFYKELVDNLFDGVYFVDRERVITYWKRGLSVSRGIPPRAYNWNTEGNFI